jgi:hypothetical protein
MRHARLFCDSHLFVINHGHTVTIKKEKEIKMTTTSYPSSQLNRASWAYRLTCTGLILLLVVLVSSGLIFSFASAVLVFSLGALAYLAAQMRRKAREGFIARASLPASIKTKLRETYLHLSAQEADLAEQGLRDFFLASLQSKHFMAMPSQAVDVIWHEFILHTKAYQLWCDQALGYFLHHTPAEALGGNAQRNDGLRRIWYWACQQERIDPRKPERLPFLFALDNRLRIPNGFRYAPDCSFINGKEENQQQGGCGGGGGGDVHCGTSLSSASFSGSSGDFGGAEGGSGGDSGDGGGGCGGGD